MKEAVPINLIPDTNVQRFTTGLPGFDHFLGGGLVPGTVILFAGEPGVGKSTLLLQIANQMAQTGLKVLYVTGEESLSQIKVRANRLKALCPYVLCSESIELDNLVALIHKHDPKIVIVDSLQTAYTASLAKEAGSKAQILHVLDKLIKLARDENRILLTIGHSTKAGMIAGLQTLQHMVDVTMYMYTTGGENRRLFSKKNRYGPAQLNWDILMTEDGIVDPQFATPKIVETQLPPPGTVPHLLRLPYAQIQQILNQRWLDRYAITKDMEYLLEKQFGKGLKIKGYDITYELDSDQPGGET